jgi:hypothetical protein
MLKKNCHLSFAALLLGLLLAACGRERDTVVPDAQYQDGFPLAVGNYWIYRTTATYYNGHKQIFNTVDSVWIEKDTVVDGKRVFVQKSTYYPNLKIYLRDSAGCIISNLLQYQSIVFSTNLRDTLEHRPPFYVMMLDADQQTRVWAGTFRTVNCMTLLRMDADGHEHHNQPMYDRHFMINEQKRYANRVGMVKRVTYFHGNTIENDLVRYHVR